VETTDYLTRYVAWTK